ncbi:MAG: complex I subunit 1 family protein [Deltaproteobacteria bacterium]
MKELFSILIFPGFLFLCLLSFMAEFLDRKLHARMQNRIGPPWFQPFADFIKLVSKEEIIPREANTAMFLATPVFALAATVTAFLYVPLWNAGGLSSFDGDVIVVLYLLTIPTMAIFLGGWYSTSLFSRLGAVRAITQLFAYEVPLFIGILSAALLAGTWSLSGIRAFFNSHPALWLVNIAGFCVSLIALMGKLERVPFDIPEAETEIVAGSFTEYSGRSLALFRLTLGVEMVVGASLLAAVFFPMASGIAPAARFALYLAEVAVIVGLIALLRTLFARLRLDQMVAFCWRYVAPLGIFQLLVNLFLKGFVVK